MTKKAISIILSIILALGVALPGFATGVEPRATAMTPLLTFDGTTANCSGTVISAGSEIEATIILRRGNRVIDSWSASGTHSVYVSGSCQVNEGYTYTLTLSGTVNGVNFTPVSTSATC